MIVDAPATGHGIGLMQTPKNFAEIARVGPMAQQASMINRTITNHRQGGAVIVALPEEMPVNESATLEAELLGPVGVAVDRIYMNALYPAALRRRRETAAAGWAAATRNRTAPRAGDRRRDRRGAAGQSRTRSSSTACGS